MIRHRNRALQLCRSFAKRATQTFVVGVTGALVVLGNPTAAHAEFEPTPVYNDPPGMFTEATITGTGAGSTVTGSVAPTDFNPLAGYPATVPAGSTPHDPAFAGTITIQDRLTGHSGLTYCIDLNTSTEVGVNYELGEWSETHVPNLGYVEYILQHYYPATDEPSSVSVSQRAAAVQAAIWFLTDRYVLDTASPIRSLTAAIVADTLANGPSAEPERPELSVTPSELAAPSTGEIVGPFTVNSDGPATIRVTGIEVFTDPEGINQLHDGDVVEPGTRLWARSVSGTEPQGFVLERTATVLEGTVLLYDGSNPGLDDAQKLILARETELVVRAGAVLERFAAGGLQITKQILGGGAGHQGEITIDVLCHDPNTGQEQHHTVTIPAGATAGDHNRTIGGIPAGSTCTITEPTGGDNDQVHQVGSPAIEPATVTIVADETQHATVTDTFEQSAGDVEIDKTIKGPGAGKQGEVVIRLDCDVPGGAFDRRFVIEAGAEAGTYRQPVVSGVPAGTHCTVAESTTGENKKVRLAEMTITPRSITVQAGVTSRVSVTDKYVKRRCGHGSGHKPGGAGNKPGGMGGSAHWPGGHLADTGASLPTGRLAASSLALVLAGAVTVAVAGQAGRRRPRI